MYHTYVRAYDHDRHPTQGVPKQGRRGRCYSRILGSQNNASRNTNGEPNVSLTACYFKSAFPTCATTAVLFLKPQQIASPSANNADNTNKNKHETTLSGGNHIDSVLRRNCARNHGGNGGGYILATDHGSEGGYRCLQ